MSGMGPMPTSVRRQEMGAITATEKTISTASCSSSLKPVLRKRSSWLTSSLSIARISPSRWSSKNAISRAWMRW